MSFVPALKYHFLTPIYDTFLSFWLPEIKIRNKTIKLAQLSGSEKILDFGCGTGTLLIHLAEKYKGVSLQGVDTDPKILKLAETKDLNKRINWTLTDSLENTNERYDVIFSTWVFHHFTDAEKVIYLKKCSDLLTANGRMILVDWGKPSNVLMKFLFFVVQCFDSFETMRIHRKGLFPSLFPKAGFRNWEETAAQNTWFGTLKYWVLKKA